MGCVECEGGGRCTYRSHSSRGAGGGWEEAGIRLEEGWGGWRKLGGGLGRLGEGWGEAGRRLEEAGRRLGAGRQPHQGQTRARARPNLSLDGGWVPRSCLEWLGGPERGSTLLAAPSQPDLIEDGARNLSQKAANKHMLGEEGGEEEEGRTRGGEGE